MFRTFPDSLYHDTDFSNHQYGKHNQEVMKKVVRTEPASGRK